MITRTLKKIYYGTRYLSERVRGVRWLFVLGHMRAGSSLLVHVLNSNPEILGYGETHLDYRGRRSLVKLHGHVCEQFENHSAPVNEDYTYVMDKILWPHIVSNSVLCVRPLRIIVIVRNPADALPSILSRNLESIQTPEEALDYYVRTIQRVGKELNVYGRSFFLLKYENLVNKTEYELRKITEYLDLNISLTPEYDLMWSTGKKGISDDSSSIYMKKVQNSGSNYEIDIPDYIVSRGQSVYQQFIDKHRFNSFKRNT